MSNELMTKDRQILNRLFEAMTAQTDRIDQVEERMQKVEVLVEKDVYITPRQAAKFRNAVKSRIRELLPDEDDYANYSKKYFSAIYNEIYTRFAISQYRELPRKEFEAALAIIQDWELIKVVHRAGMKAR